jgi:hypothetical protein
MNVNHKLPMVSEVLAAMSSAGGWYLRRRSRVKQALWLVTEDGSLVPATSAHVVDWLRRRFPRVKRCDADAVLAVAEATITDLKYHRHGLRVITDDGVDALMREHQRMRAQS